MNIKQNVPQVRFKGFTDNWERRELGEVFTQTSNYVNPKEDNVELWSLTVEEGLIPKTERYTRDFLVKKEDKFKEVRPGDIVYNPMNMTLGAIGYNNMSKGIAVSGYYVTMVTNFNTDSYFINTWLKSPQAILTYKNYATGSLKEKQRIQFPTLSAISVPFPSLTEQQQIGNYFSNLDHLITLHQRKLETLKKLKKSMLQKMFPKNGSTYPEIRFSGFTDAWEQREFSKQYNKVSEKNDLSYGTDKIISVANMYFKEDTKESNDDYMRTYNIMRLGDIAFEGNKSKNYAHGRFVENTIGDGIVSHVFDVFRPIADYDLLFWKYIINNENIMGRIMTRCTKASTMMTNLVADDFLKEKIAVPSLEEQQHIGTFFDNLDRLITLHQRKLETLKKLKKSMLQKMFI